MMRRVSSRQRLVSWDSFDAVQRELDSNDGDEEEEESSFEDFSVPNGDDGLTHLLATTTSVPADEGAERGKSQPGIVEPEHGLLSGVPLFKRKRAPRRRKSKGNATTSTTTRMMLNRPSKDGDKAEASENGASNAAAIKCDDQASFPRLMSQTDDVVVHLSGFLDLAGVRNLAQASRRFRELLRREEYVWNVQARRLWTTLPMAGREISWDAAASSRGPTRPSLSKVEVLALARHPVPTEVDSSIFTPSRWSRNLRSRSVMVRSSLHKELAVVPTDDPQRPAVRFVGTPGQGDRSVRANAPLPRPARTVSPTPNQPPQPPQERGGCWRAASFFRRPAAEGPLSSPFSPLRSEAGSPLSAPSEVSSAAQAQVRSKWQPFVVPTLAQPQQGGGLVWDVSPRLISYFEVEILPSAAAPADAHHASGTPAWSRRPPPPPPSSHHGRVRFRLDEDSDEDDDDDDSDGGEAPAPAHVPWIRHSKECVAVGLATEEFSMHSRMPGWDPHSWGYHGDDAGLFHGAGSMLRSYGESYGCGDTVGCGVDWVREKVFFTLNGRSLGDAFDFASAAADIIGNSKSLYPVVGIDTTCLVRVNLTGPFRFDLRSAMAEQEPAVSAALLQMKNSVQ